MLADHLKTHWRLNIKPSSREFIVARGRSSSFRSSWCWKQVSELECLGHLVADDGSIEADWQRAVRKVPGAFWANAAHRSLRHAQLHRKLKLIDRCCRPQFDFRNTRWPPTKQQCLREDGLQRKMIAILQRYRPHDSEPLDDFFARRRSLANAAAKQSGLWSTRHIRRCLGWRDHLKRARNCHSWPAALLEHESADWLATLRVLTGRGTGTRLGPGAPRARWVEAVDLFS